MQNEEFQKKSHDLAVCPFCGGEAKLNQYVFCRAISYYVGCEKCNVTQTANVYFSEEEAIETWNTRKPMDDIVERLEELKAKPTGIVLRCAVD